MHILDILIQMPMDWELPFGRHSGSWDAAQGWEAGGGVCSCQQWRAILGLEDGSMMAWRAEGRAQAEKLSAPLAVLEAHPHL